MFQLEFTDTAEAQLQEIEEDKSDAGLVKQVKKTLGFLQINPKHPSLNTHEYESIPNPINPKQKVFEAYAQNKTPSASGFSLLTDLLKNLRRWEGSLPLSQSQSIPNL